MITHEHALKNGIVLNNYIIIKILGAGGFGITYLAKDKQLGMEVVIKEYFPSDLAIRKDDSTIISKSSNTENDFKKGMQRFEEEAQTLAKFNHPSIVKILGYFEANNTAYFVMEYEEGIDLAQYMKQKSESFTQDEIITIIMPILEGLKEVHSHHYLHRDIKPGNILLRTNKPPVLIDFGASKLAIGEESKSITSMLTEGYAPLEQYNTDIKQQGAFTDIYAIAAVIYKMITGEVPPSAQTRSYDLLQDGKDPFKALSLMKLPKSKYDISFLAAIDRALSIKAKDRTQTISEFQKDIVGELYKAKNNTGKYITIVILLLTLIFSGYFYIQQSNEESLEVVPKPVIETVNDTSQKELRKAKKELEELKLKNEEEARQRKSEKKHIEQKIEKKQKKKIVEIVSGQIFYIQIGSFSQSPSSRFLKVIKDNGFNYKLATSGATKRLLLGPYKDRESAEEALVRARDRINKSSFIVKVKSVGTEDDLKEVIVNILNGFKNKDQNVLNQLIHPNYGFSVIYLIGSQGIGSETSQKIDFSLPMPNHFPYDYHFSLKGNIQFSPSKLYMSPKFDYGTERWNRQGLFYIESKNDDFLSKIILKKNYTSYLEVGIIDKLVYLKDKSYRIVYSDVEGNELVFYVTLINKQWYLTLLDRYSSDM